MADDEPLQPRHPAHQHALVYCDESGIDGARKFMGFGSLWLPYERRGDLTGLVRRLREVHVDFVYIDPPFMVAARVTDVFGNDGIATVNVEVK